jgi:Helix-turn-helix domain
MAVMGPGVRMGYQRRSLPRRSYEDDGRVVMIGRTSAVIGGTIVLPDVTQQPTVSATSLRAVVEFAVTRGAARRPLLLLHSGTRFVREAAARVGFSDPTAFSRAFKRWTGRSPSMVGRAG